jgi:hypothetical protein
MPSIQSKLCRPSFPETIQSARKYDRQKDHHWRSTGSDACYILRLEKEGGVNQEGGENAIYMHGDKQRAHVTSRGKILGQQPRLLEGVEETWGFAERRMERLTRLPSHVRTLACKYPLATTPAYILRHLLSTPTQGSSTICASLV